MGESASRPNTKQIAVRVSDDLLRDLIADAEANGRNLAQTVRFHLRRALGLS